MTTLTTGAPDTRVVATAKSPWRFARYLGVPLAVGLACLAMYVYVQNQDLDNIERRIINAANIQRAAIEQIQISLWATALTLVVAIPLGIALTRPWARLVTPYIIAVANIGQGVPAIGLLFAIYILLLRNGRPGPPSSGWRSTPCCRCCAAPWWVCSRSTGGSSRPPGAWG